MALGEYCDNAVLNPLNPASMDLTDIDSATGINGVVSVTEIARKKNAGNILALSRVDLFAKRGDLIAVVGQVGSVSIFTELRLLYPLSNIISYILGRVREVLLAAGAVGGAPSVLRTGMIQYI